MENYVNILIVNKFMKLKLFLMFKFKCRGWVKKSHSLRGKAALQSGGTAVDTSVALARQQQGEQAVAGVDFVF